MTDREQKLMDHALVHGSVCIGHKNGDAVYVSYGTLAQFGLREITERLGMTRRFPVRTTLAAGYDVVMVEANSQEEAIERYLNRSKHEQD